MSSTGSRFCGDCGAPMGGGQTFCGACGAKTWTNTHHQAPPAPTRNSRSRAMLGVGLGFGGALLVLAAVIGWTELRRDTQPVVYTATTIPTVTEPPAPQADPPRAQEPKPEVIAPPVEQPIITSPPASPPAISPPPAKRAAAVKPAARTPAPVQQNASAPATGSVNNAIPDLPPLPTAPVQPNTNDSSRPTLPTSELPNLPTTQGATQQPQQAQQVQQAQQPAVALHVPATYQGPNSGVITWSGQIDKNGTVTIDGDRASSGSLNGKLPAVPVIIDIDAREFALAEVPSPSNGWKRLVVRSRNRKQTTLTIHWRVPR